MGKKIDITPEQVVAYIHEKKCDNHNFSGKDTGIKASRSSAYLQKCCCQEFSAYLETLFMAVVKDNISEEDLRLSTMSNTRVVRDIII